jgi:hypothetical protein
VVGDQRFERTYSLFLTYLLTYLLTLSLIKFATKYLSWRHFVYSSHKPLIDTVKVNSCCKILHYVRNTRYTDLFLSTVPSALCLALQQRICVRNTLKWRPMTEAKLLRKHSGNTYITNLSKTLHSHPYIVQDIQRLYINWKGYKASNGRNIVKDELGWMWKKIPTRCVSYNRTKDSQEIRKVTSKEYGDK